MSVRVSVNGASLAGRAEQAAQAATQAVMSELFAAFQQSFMAKAWDWPRDLPTRKLKGDTIAKKLASYNKGEGVRAGNPRNIVDVGNLRQTGYYEFTGPYTARFVWSAVYARLVHEGGVIRPWGNRRRRMILPARPWTAAVLGRVTVPGIRPFPIEQRLRDVWIAKFRASQG